MKKKLSIMMIFVIVFELYLGTNLGILNRAYAVENPLAFDMAPVMVNRTLTEFMVQLKANKACTLYYKAVNWYGPVITPEELMAQGEAEILDFGATTSVTFSNLNVHSLYDFAFMLKTDEEETPITFIQDYSTLGNDIAYSGITFARTPGGEGHIYIPTNCEVTGVGLNWHLTVTFNDGVQDYVLDSEAEEYFLSYQGKIIDVTIPQYVFESGSLATYATQNYDNEGSVRVNFLGGDYFTPEIASGSSAYEALPAGAMVGENQPSIISAEYIPVPDDYDYILVTTDKALASAPAFVNLLYNGYFVDYNKFSLTIAETSASAFMIQLNALGEAHFEKRTMAALQIADGSSAQLNDYNNGITTQTISNITDLTDMTLYYGTPYAQNVNTAPVQNSLIPDELYRIDIPYGLSKFEIMNTLRLTKVWDTYVDVVYYNGLYKTTVYAKDGSTASYYLQLMSNPVSILGLSCGGVAVADFDPLAFYYGLPESHVIPMDTTTYYETAPELLLTLIEPSVQKDIVIEPIYETPGSYEYFVTLSMSDFPSAQFTVQLNFTGEYVPPTDPPTDPGDVTPPPEDPPTDPGDVTPPPSGGDTPPSEDPPTDPGDVTPPPSGGDTPPSEDPPTDPGDVTPPPSGGDTPPPEDPPTDPGDVTPPPSEDPPADLGPTDEDEPQIASESPNPSQPQASPTSEDDLTQLQNTLTEAKTQEQAILAVERTSGVMAEMDQSLKNTQQLDVVKKQLNALTLNVENKLMLIEDSSKQIEVLKDFLLGAKRLQTAMDAPMPEMNQSVGEMIQKVANRLSTTTLTVEQADTPAVVETVFIQNAIAKQVEGLKLLNELQREFFANEVQKDLKAEIQLDIQTPQDSKQLTLSFPPEVVGLLQMQKIEAISVKNQNVVIKLPVSEFGTDNNTRVSIEQIPAPPLREPLAEEPRAVYEFSLAVDGAVKDTFSRPLTLTFDLRTFELENAPQNELSVYKYDSELQVWKPVGGIVDPQSGVIFVKRDNLSQYTVLKTKKSFTDADNSWAKEEINAMLNKGIVSATAKFDPKSILTRGEFAQWIANAYGLKVSSKNVPFKDVPKDSAYYNAIAAVYQQGLLQGSKDKFNPDKPLTQNELAAALGKVLVSFDNKQKSGKVTSKYLSQLKTTQVASWAEDDMALLMELGMNVDAKSGSATMTKEAVASAFMKFYRS